MAYTAIDDPEAYFQVKVYTGDGVAIGSGGQSITLDGDTDMQPDLVWIKCSSTTHYHVITDAVRGATKQIYPNDTQAEGTRAEGLTAFGSDGFTLGDENDTNQSSATYVAWCWKESATAGFDIVAYTGDGSDDRTVSHSLSASVNFVIVKRRNQTSNWLVQGDEVGSGFGQYMELNATNAVQTASDNIKSVSSSVLTLGTNGSCNESDDTYVAYCFAGKQGFSKFGVYEGNGSADGTFVYTGFRPAYILIKQLTDSGQQWEVFDNKRDGYNDANRRLHTDDSAAEPSASDRVRILSNGFKLVTSGGTHVNGDGKTHIYMAFAEAPFVNSNGVPCNAR